MAEIYVRIPAKAPSAARYCGDHGYLNQRREAVGEVQHLLSEFGGNFTVIAFSAWKKIGLEEVRGVLSNWFLTMHGSDLDE